MGIPRRFLRLLAPGCAVLLAMLAATTVAAAEANSYKKILYLTGEGLDHLYYNKSYLSFKDELDKQLPNGSVVYIENLDLAKFTEPAYKPAVTEWMRAKYAHIKFDAIVVAGTPTLRLAAEANLWPGVPTYFSNANEKLIGKLPLPANFAGQTFSIRFSEMAKLISTVLPATRRIVLVGNAPKDEIYPMVSDSELAAFAGRFSYTDLRGKPLDEVLAAVRDLPDNAVIYRGPYTRDLNGRTYDGLASLDMMTAVTNRPVLIDYTHFLGHGVLSATIDPEPQGRNAAHRVIELLRGADPATMPRVHMAFYPSFDWRELQRWGIARKSLPPGSQIRFYSPTLWEQYRVQIMATVGLIALLSSLIIALLIERRRRGIAVAEARKRLVELAHLNRSATALVYSGAIAHELNQPLAAILANAQAARMMLAIEPPALSEVREILDDIERDDQRAAELIRGMRRLLKKEDSVHVALDINAVVSKAVLFIRPEARLRQVAIRLHLPEEPLQVLGDSVLLQQVLINLVINGMEAMNELAPVARVVDIAVSLAQGDKAVVVAVADAGPGFSADANAAFTALVTTKVHGTGLGLAITAALVREHGGSIAAVNVPGSGARVTFTLPRLMPAAAGPVYFVDPVSSMSL